MSLLLHAGAQSATRTEVEFVPTPRSKGRWHPVSHYAVLRMVEAEIQRRGLNITEEAHGLNKDGSQYFGFLRLNGSTELQDARTTIGVRNSHDQRFAASVIMGNEVFVCDNLVFSGEIQVARKHTTYILTDLDQGIENAFNKMGVFNDLQQRRHNRYQEVELIDMEANDLIVRAALDEGIIPARSIPKVVDQWRAPNHPEFEARTLWSLYNAFSEVWKGTNPHKLIGASASLHTVLDRFAAAA